MTAPREPDDRPPEPDDRPPRDSLWALIPRRSLTMVVALLIILAGVIALRQRTGALARAFSQALLGAQPAGPPPPPRVRMAPVKPP